MIKLNIKALSVNEAYKGRRFRTPKHDAFKTAIKYLLPSHYDLPKPPYCIEFIFGVSSQLSDGDNLVKCAQDSIADRYGFNDRLIKKWIIEVEQTEKGKEFIKFRITSK